MPSHRYAEDLPNLSTMQWLVLALVIEQPSYGYEIGERYDRRFGSFLPIVRHAIYSMLNRLEQVGLVERLPLDLEAMRSPRRLRIKYGPTTKATHTHKQWLSSPFLAERWHNELLARIGTAHLHGAAATLDLLGRYAHHAEVHRTHIEALMAESSADGQQSLRGHTTILLLQEQLDATAAHITWVRLALAEVKRLAADGR